MHTSTYCVLLATAMSLIAASTPCRVDSDLCQRNSQLDISFGLSGNVWCDETLARARTSEMPEVDFAAAQHGQRYLFVMFDPDAPVPGCSFLHALAMVTFQNGQMNTETSFLDYRAPSPPSGTHRYQMYLYEWVSNDDSVTYDPRPFSIAKLETDNNLSQAVAVFQFRVPS
ncbi:uncharacterized protein LOC124272199 isoform X1 [Haliotis rubra]|uniref:uncharacterized protein LOC124272199 isoform X1 n=1 Tax=Haliotis rubra TaxID=36100 RepID=UPI001EE60BC0|nr:uncharacterized protein LOC124272199 isoform X1 [Haliotis rubra]